jgi:hypothetical protein
MKVKKKRWKAFDLFTTEGLEMPIVWRLNKIGIGKNTGMVEVSIASTPVLPLRMPPPRRISCFEIYVDHPQKWDFWIHHRRSAEKEPNRAKQLYIRLTGSRAVTTRYTSEAQSPAPDTSYSKIWRDILEGQERSWGWVLGLSFCVWLFAFFVVVTCSRLSLCLFFSFITSCSHSLFFFTKKLNDYLFLRCCAARKH